MASITKRTSKTTGETSWRARVRVKGAAMRTRTFARKTDAVAWAGKTESDLGHRAFVPTTADRRRTLDDLIDAFITDHLPVAKHRKSAHKVTAYLNWWKAHAGHITLDRLTAPTIAEYKARLTKQTSKRSGKPISGATTNRHLAALSAACKWAWKERGWLPGNPVLSVSKMSEGAGVVRALSDDERASLLKAAREDVDPNVFTAIVLALTTGQRAGSLRMLTWDDDVDLDDRRAICLRDSKNGEGRWVPLMPMAIDVLREHFDRDPTGEGWVFKSTKDDSPAQINAHAWMRVKRAAKLTGAKNFRFHDLRHTTGTYLNEAGATAIQIAAALGHKTLAMAQRYSHQSAEFTRSVFDKLSDRVGVPAPKRRKSQ